MRIAALLVVAGCATAADSSSSGDGKADGTASDGSWIFRDRTYVNYLDAHYMEFPADATGHIQSVSCDGANCAIIYYQNALSRVVTARFEKITLDPASPQSSPCTGRNQSPWGTADFKILDDGQGGLDYAYKYRFSYLCAGQQLNFGAADADQLDHFGR